MRDTEPLDSWREMAMTDALEEMRRISADIEEMEKRLAPAPQENDRLVDASDIMISK